LDERGSPTVEIVHDSADKSFNPCFYLDERGSFNRFSEEYTNFSFNPCFYLDERGSFINRQYSLVCIFVSILVFIWMREDLNEKSVNAAYQMVFQSLFLFG